MEKERITGKIDEIKGKAEQGAGRVSGNSRLEAEGVIDEVKGKLKEAYGAAKDAIKKTDKRAGTDVDGK